MRTVLFVELTRKDGTPLWVNKYSVVAVHEVNVPESSIAVYLEGQERAQLVQGLLVDVINVLNGVEFVTPKQYGKSAAMELGESALEGT